MVGYIYLRFAHDGRPTRHRGHRNRNKTESPVGRPSRPTHQPSQPLVNKFFIMVFLCWRWRRHFGTFDTRIDGGGGSYLNCLHGNCNGVAPGWPGQLRNPHQMVMGRGLCHQRLLAISVTIFLLWDLFSYRQKHTHTHTDPAHGHRRVRRAHENIVYS